MQQLNLFYKSHGVSRQVPVYEGMGQFVPEGPLSPAKSTLTMDPAGREKRVHVQGYLFRQFLRRKLTLQQYQANIELLLESLQ